jgi:DNA replication licensing factor MCM2
MNIKQGFPVFYTFIEANSIKKHTDINSIDTNQEKTFMELAKRPDFAELLYNSIAPSIYGHYEVKQALAFALFGGNEKNIV